MQYIKKTIAKKQAVKEYLMTLEFYGQEMIQAQAPHSPLLFTLHPGPKVAFHSAGVRRPLLRLHGLHRSCKFSK